MGWFWADSQRPAAVPVATTTSTTTSTATPPPGCPMHKSGATAQLSDNTINESSIPSACPIKKSPNSPFYAAPRSSAQQQASDNVDRSSSTSTKSSINSLNYMFSFISQERAPTQTVDLPVDREVSTIPRADGAGGGTWEYPSPQQMYNAMLRKGYTDTPQDAVESMVAVHNFLNEGAWAEIAEWEEIFSKGLISGWQKCRRGNENLAMELARERMRREREDDYNDQPSLVRFQGRPQELSPRARMMQALGWLYPAKFGTEPPFDRHDWYVSRHTPSGPKEVRYVIDYYQGPPEPTGEPVFFLDIRPAVDTPTAAVERLVRWGGDVWWRASGGPAREHK